MQDLKQKAKNVELLAPAGTFTNLMTAINAGCNAIYFGVDGLNMRQNNSAKFTLDDLQKIAEICHEHNVTCYLALNTLVYDNNLSFMKETILAAKKAGVDALIMFDPSAIAFAHEVGMEVHISTQHSISNIEAVKFFSQWADRMVLARELTLEQVCNIVDQIKELDIRGPKGELVEIEVFVHGAMCVSVSGRCGMSLFMNNTSANCGECTQPCRRPYIIKDQFTKTELVVDNEYVMSPEDLCTIGMLDKIIASGVVSLKIEGRGRSPEYVDMVVKTYRDAISSIENETYTADKIQKWNKDLGTVFNKGLSDGFYMGKAWSYWSGVSGNKATQIKELVGTVRHFYPEPMVAEVEVHASDLKDGEKGIFTGPTTGVVHVELKNMLVNEKPTNHAKQGEMITFVVSEKVRRGDKFYKFKDA